MQATAKIWMNGELVDWDDAKIHVGTHGLHYGSGVFEGIRCYETPGGPAVFRLTDHLQRLHASIESIRDMQTTAIQVNLGMINLNETEVTKKLAAWAAIIAVPTMIAGIYGMNFKNMPELEWIWGYPLAMAAMIALDVALYVWFRKIRWL